MAEHYITKEARVAAWEQACYHLSHYRPAFRHGMEIKGMASDFGLPEEYDMRAYLIIGTARTIIDEETTRQTRVIPRIPSASTKRLKGLGS